MQTKELLIAVLLTSSACSTSAPRMPSPVPPSGHPDTGSTASQARLTLTVGQFRYDLLHNATVQVEGGTDTLQSSITTTGILVVQVIGRGDSTYTVTVEADSLHLDTRGPASAQTLSGPVRIGPVLQASFTRHAVTVENQLADSLCTYGQLLSTARELVMPQLRMDGSLLHRANARDTSITTVCRAGSRITVYTTRDLTDLRRQPQEFAIRGRTELAGTGTLRNDSVAVTGSLTSQGTISFGEGRRLPRKVETQSNGRITVQIGDSTTVFHQTATQVVELRHALDSLQVPPTAPPN
jgi:hypothetical protein